MGLTFAVPDLHGRFDLLERAMRFAVAYGDGRRGAVVFLGDYIDRGPQSRDVLDALIGWQRQPPEALIIICLKGNHEDMMARCLRKEAEIAWWLGNGGIQTLLSYGEPIASLNAPTRVPPEHLRWIDLLPLVYTDEHRIFVHAGLDFRIPFDEQTAETLLWQRYRGEPAGPDARHVVHGHTPHRNGPVLLADRTNLDTLAYATGRLAIGVFDDQAPGGPIDLIDIVGPAAQ